ncbi:unnamed protein product [Sphacelaria rigidula]
MVFTWQVFHSDQAAAPDLGTGFNMPFLMAGGTEFVSMDRRFKRPLQTRMLQAKTATVFLILDDWLVCAETWKLGSFSVKRQAIRSRHGVSERHSTGRLGSLSMFALKKSSCIKSHTFRRHDMEQCRRCRHTCGQTLQGLGVETGVYTV